EEFVERAAFVRLVVRERHVAQALDRHRGGHRLPRRREQAPRAGVEQQRRVVADEILVIRKAAGDVAERRVDAENVGCDLFDPRAGFLVDYGPSALLWAALISGARSGCKGPCRVSTAGATHG